MRLKRIVALHYGELPPNASLGELDPALTVVLGPNESGKTTYTSLVRHVLFGFPDRRSSERLYLPPNGDKRAGRLVFADGDAEWSVTRFDGPHGGSVEDQQGWLPRVTSGVSAEVYRSILGFGLDELSDARTLEELQQRLYATAAGLRVDPHEVREALRGRAEALWSPQARSRLVHRLNSELKDVRARVREAERKADDYRAGRAALDELAAEAERLTGRARASRLQAGKLAALAARTRDLERQLQADGDEADALQLALGRTDAEAAELIVDEELLARGAALDELAVRTPSAQEAVLRAERARDRLGGLRAVIGECLEALGEGWDERRVARVPAELSVEAGIDDMEARLRESERHLEESARLAEDASARSARLLAELNALAERLQLPEEDTERAARVRLHAVEALLKQAPYAARGVFPAVAAAAAALAMALAGAALGNVPLAVAAALPLGLAAYLGVLWGRSRSGSDDALLRAAGVASRSPERLLTLQADLSRYRQVAAEAWDADGKRAVLEGKAEDVAKRGEDALVRWETWLAERGLESVGGPLAARASLREVRRAQQASRDAAQAEAEEAEAVEDCSRYSLLAREAGVIGEGEDDTLATVAAVRSAREALSAAREARARRESLEAERRRQLSEIGRLRERTRRAEEQIAAALEETGVESGGGVPELEALANVALSQAERDEEELRDALQRRGVLEGKLDTLASDDEAARLRLEEAGLVERLRQVLDEWALVAMAGALMDETLAEYERDRQPEIVRRARDTFEAMTGGRYPRLSTPLGSFAITVEDRENRGKEAAVLSRGTAEQLYLALRIAYIDSLRDAHPALPVLMDDVLVNFDDEGRQAAAARVIAAFSRTRQVVFFTCHERVARLFAEAAPEHALVRLERC